MSKLKVKDLPVVLLNTLSVFGATMAGVVPSSGPIPHSEPGVDTRRSRLMKDVLQAARTCPISPPGSHQIYNALYN